DVAELLQCEEVRGVLRIAELVGGGLVDRNRDRTRRGICPPAGMERERFGMKRGIAHDRFLCAQLPQPLRARKRVIATSVTGGFRLSLIPLSRRNGRS